MLVAHYYLLVNIPGKDIVGHQSVTEGNGHYKDADQMHYVSYSAQLIVQNPWQSLRAYSKSLVLADIPFAFEVLDYSVLAILMYLCTQRLLCTTLSMAQRKFRIYSQTSLI